MPSIELTAARAPRHQRESVAGSSGSETKGGTLVEVTASRGRLTRTVAPAVLALILVSSAHAQVPPSFSKSFSPSTVGPGSVSTLTFTISNAGSATPATSLAFTDDLPAGLVIATPANASTTCNATLDAPAGGTTIALDGGGLGANETCTVAVDVVGNAPGVHTNLSGDLTSSAGNSGTATADLTVSTGVPGFTKSFAPSAIAVGGTSTLTLTIDNSANASDAFNLAFTDTLPEGLTIATPANAATDCGGILNATAGGSSVSLIVGMVAAMSTCTVTVDVTTETAGTFANTTGNLTSNLGSSGKASAALTVSVNLLRKRFTGEPGLPGGTVGLEFTLINLDRSDDLTNIAFTDDLDATLSGLTAIALPLSDPCGPGSQLSGTSLLALTGGSLAAEGSCTFSVTLQVPANAATGTYVNTTSTVTADLGGVPVVKDPATDNLTVEPAPILTKTFTDDPVAASDTVTVEYSITNSDPDSDATSIAFTDDLTALVPGMTATALPADGFCGAGSHATGSTQLSFTGGSLGPGASCTFSATLQVPASAAAGTYSNPTGVVTATVEAMAVTGSPASDDLVVVAAPRLTKTFVDDPVLAGGIVTLEFTLSYDEGAPAAGTDIAFTDDLSATLAGLTAVGLPAADVCGAGSQLSGTTTLSFTGGSLGPGESCTFTVMLQVPGGTPPGTLTNTTSTVTATMLGLPATGPAASDDLDIAGLALTKTFVDDPVVPGATVTLEFTASNLTTGSTITNVAFTDNLTNILPGLTAVGLPASDVCGAGSMLSGTTTLTLTGGTLSPDSSCIFSVTLQVPDAAAGGEYTNVTSAVSGDVDGTPMTVAPAHDTLIVAAPLALTKSFTDDPVVPGGTATLEFTVSNLSTTQSATDVAFTDDLDAALTSLVATGLPASDVCGAGSEISGTGLLMFTGGSLAPGASCTFSVTVAVPGDVSVGTTVTNTTSAVTGTVGAVEASGAPATDDLRIDFFAFGKTFTGPAAAGGHATLRFTLENLSTDSVSGLAFVDDLDAVLSGLVATGLPASDVCGEGSTLAGTSVLTLTGGSLAAGESCTFDVVLAVPIGTALGSYPNTTGDLLADGLRVAGPATAALEIVEGVDHLVGYRVREPSRDVNGDRLPGRNRLPKDWVITVDDARIDNAAEDDPENFVVRRTVGVLNPAEKNGEGGPLLPEQSYLEYQLRLARESVADAVNGRFPKPAKHVKRVWELDNQLGTIAVESRRVESLLVPAAVASDAAPAAPPDATHYVCYGVKPTTDVREQTPGTTRGKFRRDLQAFARDQFADCVVDRDGNPSFTDSPVAGTCLFDVKKPFALCNPITKTPVVPPRKTSAVIAGSTPSSTRSLLCYQARLASRVTNAAAASLIGLPVDTRLDPRQSRHTKRTVHSGTPLFVTPGNLFPAPRLLDTNRLRSFCVPTDVLGVAPAG